MTQAVSARKPVHGHIVRSASELPADGPAWLRSLRSTAWERFQANGLPSTRLEAWRYTNVAPIAKPDFRAPREDAADVTAARLAPLTFGGLDAHLAVFVNGRFAPRLSALGGLPKGVRVASIASVLDSHGPLVEPHLARVAATESPESAFAALNTAGFADGAFVSVAPGTMVERPVHVLFAAADETPPRSGTNGNGPHPLAVQPRNMFLVGEHAQVTLIESYGAVGEAPYLVNAVTESVAADGAVVEHVRVQRDHDRAFHVSTTAVRQGRATAYGHHSISIGAGLTRNDLGVVLAGEGGDALLNGLYLPTGTQHVDNHTSIDHASPNCTSREVYKGVLDGASRGVFFGKIVVRPGAQKTNARQTNKNVLLSDGALVDSAPQLEIFADDVKCTHGSTTGQLDEDQVFYLRTRGMDRDTARGFLTYAFVHDVLGRIRVPRIGEELDELLLARLPGGHLVKEAAA